MAKTKDITGMKFGKLTVLKRSDKTDSQRVAFWYCECDCGKIKEIRGYSLRRGQSESCGCSSRGRHNPNKSGMWIDVKGYVKIMAKGHPIAHAGGEALQHRVIMSDILYKERGFHLLPSETVHHRNGIKTDNHPENLELRTGAHGPGVEVEDHITHCLEQLALYAPQLLNPQLFKKEEHNG